MNFYILNLDSYTSSDTFNYLLKKEQIKQYYYCKYCFYDNNTKQLIIEYDSFKESSWVDLLIKDHLQVNNIFLKVIPQMGN
jgi:hypothetical protein